MKMKITKNNDINGFVLPSMGCSSSPNKNNLATFFNHVKTPICKSLKQFY